MAQTIFDAMKLSQAPYSVAVLKAIATSDEVFSLIPMVAKGGESFVYTREKSLGSFDFVADNHTVVPESTGADENVTVPKREAVQDFYVRNMAQENMSGLVNQMDMQTLKKFKVAGRKIAQKLITGNHTTGFSMNAFQSGAYIDAITGYSAHLDTDRYGPGSIRYTHSGTLVQFRAPGDKGFGTAVAAASDGDYTLYSDNPSKWITVTLDVSDATADAERSLYFTSSTNEFDGLLKLMSPGQIRSASGTDGDQPTIGILDELLDAVKVKENLAFFMNASIRRKYESLFRAAGWGVPTVGLPNSNVQVPNYKGVPILTNDWIPSTETKGSASNLSSILLASLSAEEGFFLGALGGERFEVQADPRNASVLGFRIYELGQIQGGPSARGRRLAWFGAAALGSDLAAARAKQIITT